MEADQTIERQRQHLREECKKSAHMIQQDKEKDEKYEELEAEIERLKMSLTERNRDRRNPEAGRVPRPGARENSSREQGNSREKKYPYSRRRCYFCGSKDHLLRNCPEKNAWLKERRSKSKELN